MDFNLCSHKHVEGVHVLLKIQCHNFYELLLNFSELFLKKNFSELGLKGLG